jgi:ribosome-binding factor A
MPKGTQARIKYCQLHAHVYCSIFHNSQAMEIALDALQQIKDRLRKCSIHTQWSIIQP